MFRQSPTAPMTRRTGAAATEKLERAPTAEGANAEVARPRGRQPRALPPVELGPIIKSKIQPPALRPSTLSRQRLIDQLTEATKHRLTLLIAEAGYGKTTVLADFARVSGMRTLWYRLDPTDADVITWTNYIIAAAREVEPKFGEATLRLMSQLATGGPPRSTFVASLIGELGDIGATPTLIVLEDFHCVDGSDEVLDLVGRLIRDAPSWVKIVISSRRRPTLGLGRLAAMDELREIVTEDLRFSTNETAELFAEAYGVPLDTDVIDELGYRTKGWVASLQLFHGSIRGKSMTAIRALARQLSGATSPIYDFLAEEVIANLDPDLEQFLLRASLLEQIAASSATGLFYELTNALPAARAQQWIDEADRLMLLGASSQQSDAKQLHPLLREFLSRQLRAKATDQSIREMHLGVARMNVSKQPLVAAHHFLLGGQEAEAMQCIGSSVLKTMGTGQTGMASDLVDRLRGKLTDPAVAAIKARRLLEQGELAVSGTLLADLDLKNSSAAVRAIVRHTKLALGWRLGDRELMFATLREVQADPEAASVLADIFQIYFDASPMSPRTITFVSLAERMERMSRAQRESGQSYYVAISLHNAAQTMLAAGRYREVLRLGYDALTAFEAIPHVDFEKYSTHAVMAVAAFELGEATLGEDHIRIAVSSGLERGDVQTECALLMAILGATDRATQLLMSASELESTGRSDLAGQLLHEFARSLLAMPVAPVQARLWLENTPDAMPLDTGYVLDRQMMIALSYLMSGELSTAHAVAVDGLRAASARGARRCLARLELVSALSIGDANVIRQAVTAASSNGELALLTIADALVKFLWLIPEVPEEIRQSITRWPARWLPALRRELNAGGTANAMVAARMLDDHGEPADVTRLRAFAKAYRKTNKTSPSLGTSLARRAAPRLELSDLGRTHLAVGDRVVHIGGIRRKAAALLMFLVTRPGLSANREQTFEELWPETDPESAANNLNQSLYFLRREIDPWYEDDLSVEYIAFQGDLVWLDPSLTRVASVEFASQARGLVAQSSPPSAALDVMARYIGQFSPEFEYEEWAISWRSRIHAIFLELANTAIATAVKQGDLGSARDIALLGLDRDPGAADLERKLVWLYWQSGSKSAATAQHEHLASVDERDGLGITPLTELVSGRLP